MTQKQYPTFFSVGMTVFALGVFALGGTLIANFVTDPAKRQNTALVLQNEEQEAQTRIPTPEEMIQAAYARSQHVKGVYMTAGVANDQGRAATILRENILRLIDATELNGVVIDIKETDGVFLPESLKNFVSELNQKNIWAIARLVVFNDTAQARAHPEMALKRANGKLWLDRRGNAWLDPASPEAGKYIAGIAKRAVDYGFDEIQFDYIRFPSDGDVQNIIYPIFNSKTAQKYEVLAGFFGFLNRELKAHKPSIILSADLFGYVAIQQNDLGIGQRMEDIGDAFDYVSFMLYPSHYYNGFQIKADSSRGLPEQYFPYRSKDITQIASSHPYDVVYRSLLTASDFLAGKDIFANATTTAPITISASTTATEEGKKPPMLVSHYADGGTTQKKHTPRSRAKLRPWLQDFDLAVDTSRGIYYTAEKVRAQIQASEDAGASGWLLWNAANKYTETALKK